MLKHRQGIRIASVRKREHLRCSHVAPHTLRRHARDGHAGALVLERAGVHAQARARRIAHDHVEDLGRKRVRPAHDLAVGNVRRPDARGDGHVHDGREAPADTHARLRKTRDVRVVVQHAPVAAALAEELRHRKPLPTGKVRRVQDLPARKVERTRAADADALVFESPAHDCVRKPSQVLARSHVMVVREGLPPQDVALLVQRGNAKLRPADVDSHAHGHGALLSFMTRATREHERPCVDLAFECPSPQAS